MGNLTCIPTYILHFYNFLLILILICFTFLIFCFYCYIFSFLFSFTLFLTFVFAIYCHYNHFAIMTFLFQCLLLEHFKFSFLFSLKSEFMTTFIYQDDELRKRAIEELTLPEQDKPNITITAGNKLVPLDLLLSRHKLCLCNY